MNLTDKNIFKFISGARIKFREVLGNVPNGSVLSTETSPEKIKEKYESNEDTNAFTDSEQEKLGGIESEAEVNPTDVEIKAQYEANDDTNAFTDTYQSAVNNLGTLSTQDANSVNITGGVASLAKVDHIPSDISHNLSFFSDGTWTTGVAQTFLTLDVPNPGNSRYPISANILCSVRVSARDADSRNRIGVGLFSIPIIRLGLNQNTEIGTPAVLSSFNSAATGGWTPPGNIEDLSISLNILSGSASEDQVVEIQFTESTTGGSTYYGVIGNIHALTPVSDGMISIAA